VNLHLSCHPKYQEYASKIAEAQKKDLAEREADAIKRKEKIKKSVLECQIKQCPTPYMCRTFGCNPDRNRNACSEEQDVEFINGNIGPDLPDFCEVINIRLSEDRKSYMVGQLWIDPKLKDTNMGIVYVEIHNPVEIMDYDTVEEAVRDGWKSR